ANPADELWIDGTSNHALDISLNTTIKGRLGVAASAGQYSAGTAAAGDIVLRSEGGRLVLDTNSGTGTPSLTILRGTGSVGIGPAAPAQDLDVYGGALVVRGARAVPAYSNGIIMDFGGLGGANTGAIQGYDYGSATARNIALQPAGGSVGIGTPSPST